MIFGHSQLEAQVVYAGSDGELTKAYYAQLAKRGFLGELAVALFRAQKRSDAAKRYRGGKFKHAAYDVKNWSLSEICRILSAQPTCAEPIIWGWGEDAKTIGFPHVLYVELPNVMLPVRSDIVNTAGQVSFHSATRSPGPNYLSQWDGAKLSAERIITFCSEVYNLPVPA